MNKDLIKNVLESIAKGNNPSEVASEVGCEMNKVFEIKAKYFLVDGSVRANFGVIL